MGVYYFYSNYIFDDGHWLSKSIQVENDKIVITQVNKHRTKQMNIDYYWVGPGKVYIDFEDPLHQREDLESTVNRYIYRGCTLLICQLPITSNVFFKQEFEQFKATLSSLPIDYMIVPRVQASLLRPSIIKFFGKNKMPFVLIDTKNKEELLEVKWEWIQAAQYFSGIPLVLSHDEPTNKSKGLSTIWNDICEEHRIDVIKEKLTDYPLSKETLRLTGISPLKGEFLHQSSADYNLFELDKIPSIDERSKLRYHKAIPVVTVSKGEVIKANHLVRPVLGKGELKQVSIPKHFL
ncbi:hypothetical protein [Aquibacillus saliphilus]|uniref:hypothetical protein n=1 Tax=Aquibacillus saliphilus TaxID=1909422 RepID=UPI001CEFCF9A|nr:hypothetical protein [Aquibacillus saliphilus]